MQACAKVKRDGFLKKKAVANISYMLCSLRFTQHIPWALATTCSIRTALAFRLNAQSRTQKKVGKK